MERKEEIELVDYNPSFRTELDSWQEIEKEKGQNGLNRFVVPTYATLGEFLDYLYNEIQIETKIALDNENVVGFVSFDIKENKTAHIEIFGTNPKFRNLGYSKKILKAVKSFVNDKYNIEKVTLSVNKENMAGLNAFSKFATSNNELDSENYFGFEL